MAITKDSPTPSPSASPSAGANAQQNQALQQFLAGIQSGTSTGTGKVYMGSFNKLSGRNLSELSESAQAQLGQRTLPRWWKVSDAENQYFNWSDKQRADFQSKALLAGLLKQGDGDMEASKLWVNLVDQAANYGAQDKQVGPMDLLAGYVKANSAGGGWVKDPNNNDFVVNPLTGERKYVGPQFKTTTQTNVNLTDPATARAVATSVFQQLLGRDPGQNEIAAYAAALSQSEAQNPAQQSTTTQYDSQGNPVGSSSVTTGGVTSEGQQQLAADQIKKGKEYGATQAATTYMNVLTKDVGL